MTTVIVSIQLMAEDQHEETYLCDSDQHAQHCNIDKCERICEREINTIWWNDNL